MQLQTSKYPRGSVEDTHESRKVDIAFRSVQKRFGDFVAVENFTLDIYEGEFLFLLGPSGSGKTTTLRMLAGYEQPTSGTIELGGQVINDIPIEKRDIGMVFQSYALFPHKNVLENIAFGLKMRKYPKKEIEQRVDETLELVELQGLSKRYPRQLSGGQQQRVALARAIVFHPSLLLLDEPLANLDKKLRDNMRVELKNLQAKVGITTVFVTHDQEEALTMADRVAVMDQGRLVQVGAPSEIYNHPKSSFVAQFIGETNFINARVRRVDSEYAHLLTEDGWPVQLKVSESISVGDRYDLSVRPERIHIDKDGSTATGPNVYEGVVKFVTYLGHQVMYLVMFPEGTVIRVSKPTPSGVAEHQVGEPVFVWIGSDHIICLNCD